MGAFRVKLPSWKAARTESDLVVRLVCISFLFHAMLFFLQLADFNLLPVQPIEELVIEADWATNFAAEDVAEKSAEVSLSTSRPMLPQLPKNFHVKEESTERLSLGKKEPDLEKPSQEIEKTASLLSKRGAQEIEKEKALRRLKKELQRSQKKEKKKLKKEAEKLAKIERLIRSGKLLKQEKKVLSSETQRYSVAVMQKIKSRYAVPESYLDAAIEAPVVSLEIGPMGGVRHLKLKKSSKNRAFDALALKVVREAAPFPVPPSQLIGRSFNVSIDPKTL